MSPPAAGALAPRRRNGWEAADSGILLWRNNLPLILLFFALPLLVPLAAVIALPFDIPLWTALLGLWWLKPLFDRLTLRVIALRYFERDASAGRIFRELGRTLGRGLIGDLLWRRFNPRRSADMPIRILENLKPGEVRRRKKLLEKGCLNFGVLLTVLGLGLEAALLGGETVFFVMFTELFGSGPLLFIGETAGPETLLFLGYGFNYFIIESLYVCMGFGLYINSRVEVEGWDIQLLFQNFSKKPVVLALILGCVLAMPGFAQTPGPSPDSRVLEEVLAAPEFGGEREGWGIRLKEWEPGDGPDFKMLPWAERVKELIARGLRMALAASALGLAVFSVLRLRKLGRESRPSRRSTHNTAFPFPEDPRALLERARAAYGRGDVREAWASCLSSAIAACGERRGASFPRDATEYECLALVRAWDQDAAGGFSDLVRAWITLAYGGTPPPPGAFEESAGFCQSLLDIPAEDHA
jgi:hypothetical protein